MGLGALASNTTAAGNVAVGDDALNLNTTGANNVAIGNKTLQWTTTAAENTAVGAKAGDAATTASDSTFIGSEAGTAVTTGGSHVHIGYRAGDSTTTGVKLSCLFKLANCKDDVRHSINSNNFVFFCHVVVIALPRDFTASAFPGDGGILRPRLQAGLFLNCSIHLSKCSRPSVGTLAHL